MICLEMSQTKSQLTLELAMDTLVVELAGR